MILLNKLLEDGNTLFRNGRLEEAAYRYEYALKRLPRLKHENTQKPIPSSSSSSSNCPQQETATNEEAEDDVFVQLRSHLLLNLSRTKRKQRKFQEAIDMASMVLQFKPTSFEAFWARGKAKRDMESHEALAVALVDLREAIRLAPQNLELHRFTIKVKEEYERGQLEQQQRLKQKMMTVESKVPSVGVKSSEVA